MGDGRSLSQAARRRARNRGLTAALIGLSLVVTGGCSAIRDAHCSVDSCRPDPSTCTGWSCQTLGVTGDYAVDCDTDGGTACRCVKNGVVEKTLTFRPWTTNDCWERIDDANAACSWTMSTCGI